MDIRLFITLVLLISTQLQAQIATGEMPYQDDKFTCISAEKADRYIKDFGVNVASFGGKELCKASVDFKKLMNDFQIIEQGDFGAGDNLFIKGFVAAKDYYSWMKSQTRGVERGQDVPYATAYNSGGYFTMQDGWAILSTLGRVGTVIHEARHTAGYRHIPCQQGTYQGSSVAGCDSTYSYGGSHAVEMEYYARVSVQGKNFHPVYKKMARLMAIGRSNIFFNSPVIQKKESVLVLSENKDKSYLLNDQLNWVTREVPQVDSSYVLKRTSFGAVLFNLAQALSIDMYENSKYADPVEDTYSYFKLLGESADKKINDFEEYDQGVKRFVTLLSNDMKIGSYDFPNGQWGRFQTVPFQVVKTTTEITQTGSPKGYYLIQSNGQIAQFQPQNNRLVTLNNVQWNFDDLKVVSYLDKKLVLKKNGVLVEKQSDGSEKNWSLAEKLGFISDVVNVPVYDGFSVKTE